jgi:hypothetical protein
MDRPCRAASTVPLLHGHPRFAHRLLPGRRGGRVVFRREVRGHQVTARRQSVNQTRDDLRRLELIRDEVRDRDQHQRHRLAEVEQGARIRVGQDRGGVAQIGVDVGGAALGRGRQQGACVGEDERVVSSPNPAPALAADRGSEAPGIKAKPKQDRS